MFGIIKNNIKTKIGIVLPASYPASRVSYGGGSVKDALDAIVAPNAGAHNTIYRGKYLGSSVTAEQYAEIKNGTFKDLYIGDYWTIPTTISGNTTNINYRIAGFDYYLHCGDTETTAHHAVLVPDTILYSAKMNDSGTTSGGYMGSKMYTTYLADARTAIKNAFGNAHILSHRVFLTNAVSSGRASGVAWADCEVELMCEQMVYGSGIFLPVSTGTSIPYNYMVEKTQLPLFAQNPSLINIRQNWWLRDVISAADFSFPDSTGYANAHTASRSLGVRPCFCIYDA